MGEICFAIPVHDHKPVIKDLLDNIRYFCPNSEIVLYQSGEDPHLCDGLGYMVCPTSRNLEPSGTTLVMYHLEVMKWLQEIQLKKKIDVNHLIFMESLN